MNHNFNVQQGWQCPVCQYVYSPTTVACYNCNRPHHEKYKVTDGTTAICTHSDFRIILAAGKTESKQCNLCGEEF